LSLLLLVRRDDESNEIAEPRIPRSEFLWYLALIGIREATLYLVLVERCNSIGEFIRKSNKNYSYRGILLLVAPLISSVENWAKTFGGYDCAATPDPWLLVAMRPPCESLGVGTRG